jgi:mannose-6-phosphate isomerase-like protein (cupin superfamily)
VTVKAGEGLFIPAGGIHAVRNVGAGKGAELAPYIVEKGSRSSRRRSEHPVLTGGRPADGVCGPHFEE